MKKLKLLLTTLCALGFATSAIANIAEFECTQYSQQEFPTLSQMSWFSKDLCTNAPQSAPKGPVLCAIPLLKNKPQAIPSQVVQFCQGASSALPVQCLNDANKKYGTYVPEDALKTLCKDSTNPQLTLKCFGTYFGHGYSYYQAAEMCTA